MSISAIDNSQLSIAMVLRLSRWLLFNKKTKKYGLFILKTRRIFCKTEQMAYICRVNEWDMRIITEKKLTDYADAHPDARTALQEWIKIVRKSTWTCFADIKNTFNSVDCVGNQHYVFNIKGNDYRLVVVVKFTPQFVLVRFVGTHAEYDKIDCSTI